MGSSARKRQTFAKLTRERAVQEKRELKRQRKAERKAAAAEGMVVGPDGEWVAAEEAAAWDEASPVETPSGDEPENVER
jgi:hypothetical protein